MSMETDLEHPGRTSSVQSKAARVLIDQLRELGLGDRLSLPQIAVCGDTSTGKSSLLSALSGIDFPSDSQLKTRCPTQVQMTTSEGNCKRVLAHVKFATSIETINTNKEKVAELRSVKDLGDVSQVAKYIDESTEAIHILRNRENEVFPDVIVIEIASPDVPNLTLIDLPGLVRSTVGEEKAELIADVHALVKNYMKESRTIILTVVMSHVDIHNAGILTDALKADPSGERTLAVLTMPDRVEHINAQKVVASVLSNKAKRLELGWHMVRLRGQADLENGTSSEAYLRAESRYFSEPTSPYFSCAAELKGVPSLKKRLSRLLEDRIRADLPSVMKEVSERTEKLKAQSLQIGPALDSSSTRQSLFRTIVQKFSRVSILALDGLYNVECREFFANKKEHKLRSFSCFHEEKFKEEILLTTSCKYPGCSFSVGDEVLWLTHEKDWSPGTIREEKDGKFSLSDSQGDIVKVFNSSSTGWCDPKTELKHQPKKILELISENKGRELPSFLSFPCFKTLVAHFVEEWAIPAWRLFEVVYAAVLLTFGDAVDFCVPEDLVFLRQYLHQHIHKLVKNQYEVLCNELKEDLGPDGELAPFTLNHYYTDNLIKIRNKPLEAQLVALADSQTKQVSLAAVQALLHSYGVGQVSNEEYEVVEMQFRIAAYIKTARKRFIDNVKGLLQKKFFGPLSRKLLTELNAVSHARVDQLLFESDAIIRRRKQLQADLQVYQEAEKAISSFALKLHD